MSFEACTQLFFFPPEETLEFFWWPSNLSCHLWSKVKLVSRLCTLESDHIMTEKCKGVSLIKSGWHNLKVWHNKPPPTWNLLTGCSSQKLFQVVATPRLQWWCSGIQGCFNNPDPDLHRMPDVIRAPLHSPTTLAWKDGLSSLSTSQPPRTHTNDPGPQKGHGLLFTKGHGRGPQALPSAKGPSILVRANFTLLLHVPARGAEQENPGACVITVLRNWCHRLVGKRPDKLTKFLFCLARGGAGQAYFH